MEDKTTSMKIKRSTVETLQKIAKSRMRRESLEQVVLELIDMYSKVVGRGPNE